ncbi:LysE family transporter [Colwellia sp. MB02u-18]|uniref:LysE family translocator n=1 Tax=unclassified Colwellia TaxID=196834 RepID=UPI0015F39892|nr:MULTISPECIES: LysE family transporter [unclassified Colwellia]MBA6225088.1 LysE family transporter [Colwellia sp. MB3u-45]MBA6268624.1 LysE family transporter [Colwellia sp. MB3u-43]MBA6321055.1 LysE family transporter [Colwellia sp. MB02u-19]MBA6325608.1 LysE family transporter [Colwellia sp. MB02u-18]MBA6332083.1 LysE family transporter [Colwellia sp. MB02u-12]
MELLINTYMAEIIAVGTIAIFMAMLPGADFVLVTRTSIYNGRLAGLYMSLGMCLSVCIHASYSIAGLAVVIASSAWLFSAIKYLGTAYLIYIAWQLLTTREPLHNDQKHQTADISAFIALRRGFTCNILNPKTSIFFLSIFTQVVSVDTPLIMQISYGLIIMLAHFIWYSGVVLLLSHPSILPRFNRQKQKIDKVAGFILMLIAIKLSLISAI